MIKNKKNGFTLIELLAVIIILGLLLLIAVPSVTMYIDNSRKESYIVTVKELVSGASNKINSGQLEAYDPSSTYYVPIECIEVENAKTSPFGDLKDSYVVLTYDDDGYNYYYTGTDTSNMGILLTYRELLDITSINSNIKNIRPSISIGNTTKIEVFDCDGTKHEELIEDTIMEGERVEPLPSDYQQTDYIIERQSSEAINSQNLSLIKERIEKISYIKVNEFPTNAIKMWDAGTTKNGKVMAWYVDENNNGLYEVYYGSKGKIYLNAYAAQLYKGMLSLKTIDYQNIDTSLVTDMHEMFMGNGSDYHIALEHIYGLNKFNTSRVTNMDNAFSFCGNLKSLDLSSFNTKKVTTMESMFREISKYNNITKLDLSNFDLTNVSNMTDMFSWNSNLTEVRIGSTRANNLTNAKDMFQYDGNLRVLDISKLKIDSSVNTVDMLDAVPYNATIYVDSATTRDYILNNRETFDLDSRITESNFVIR